MKREEIIDLLLERKIIDSNRLSLIEEEEKRTGFSLPKVLTKMNIINDIELAQIMGEKIGVAYVDPHCYSVSPDLISLIPENVARKYKLVPLFQVRGVLTLAMANPKDVMALDEARQITGIEYIEVVLSSENSIEETIDKYYSKSVHKIDDNKTKSGDKKASKNIPLAAKDGSAIDIVDDIFVQAVSSRTSDIHIEPEKDMVRLRFRIDGNLYEIKTFSKDQQSSIISRIKLLADMDIAESRLPQDGKITATINEKELDIRVSSFLTIYGENIVMRILDKSSVLLGLSDLGFVEDDLKKFEKVIRSPYGIILVTGPTGSGKTTTLYAILSILNSTDKNIITIEDPVEYELPLIRQTQINVRAGLTFAKGLRAILRQDPDIIMVGEVRDLETAEIATQAALTGHLVLSTFHTNDATSAVTRLVEMGIEPFLVSSTVIGVLAQRLVRVICDHCKEKYEPLQEMRDLLSKFGVNDFYQGKGCDKCNNTGFLGRCGIFEFLMIDEFLKNMILKKSLSDEFRKAARERGMRTLFQDGVEKVRNHKTTPEELLRVAVQDY